LGHECRNVTCCTIVPCSMNNQHSGWEPLCVCAFVPLCHRSRNKKVHLYSLIVHAAGLCTRTHSVIGSRWPLVPCPAPAPLRTRATLPLLASSTTVPHFATLDLFSPWALSPWVNQDPWRSSDALSLCLTNACGLDARLRILDACMHSEVPLLNSNPSRCIVSNVSLAMALEIGSDTEIEM